MDIVRHNRRGWDRQVELGNPWTIPVSDAAIAAARAGQWELLLTEKKAVPRSWFPELANKAVLGLASGGGQQGPILAAAGATVTILDNSSRQLLRDRDLAAKHALDLRAVQGNMLDRLPFESDSFDLVFHPVSNLFVPAVRPIWSEAFRVLKDDGTLLAGFVNPVAFSIDYERFANTGVSQLRHRLPYSDLHNLSPDERSRLLEPDDPLEFSHTLEDQIGGQLAAGFVLVDLYESWGEADDPTAEYFPKYIATRAVKPRRSSE